MLFFSRFQGHKQVVPAPVKPAFSRDSEVWDMPKWWRSNGTIAVHGGQGLLQLCLVIDNLQLALQTNDLQHLGNQRRGRQQQQPFSLSLQSRVDIEQ